MTYPLTTALLSVLHAKTVRGFSFFGASFVYVIFDDGTDLYWARSRVLEYQLCRRPSACGCHAATRTGCQRGRWVYQYVVLAKDQTLAELRSLQDWTMRYALAKTPGVAEVASIGGFVQTWQVTVDPAKPRAYGIALATVTKVIRESNRDVGRTLEMAETEYMVRGRGVICAARRILSSWSSRPPEARRC